MARRLRRLVRSSLLEGRKGEVPGELVALALARAMQRQHIGAEQDADTQAAEPLDPLPERGMLALGGVQVGSTTTGRPFPGASHSSPSARVSAIPAAHLLMVLKVAGATMIASGSGSTSGSPGSL
jgi:hypothetical protein